MDTDENHESFDELLRSIAEEVGRSVEAAAERVDVEEIAGRFGVDPDRAREWASSAASWLRAQAGHVGEEAASRANEAERSEPVPGWRASCTIPRFNRSSVSRCRSTC